MFSRARFWDLVDKQECCLDPGDPSENIVDFVLVTVRKIRAPDNEDRHFARRALLDLPFNDVREGLQMRIKQDGRQEDLVHILFVDNVLRSSHDPAEPDDAVLFSIIESVVPCFIPEKWHGVVEESRDDHLPDFSRSDRPSLGIQDFRVPVERGAVGQQALIDRIAEDAGFRMTVLIEDARLEGPPDAVDLIVRVGFGCELDAFHLE